MATVSSVVLREFKALDKRIIAKERELDKLREERRLSGLILMGELQEQVDRMTHEKEKKGGATQESPTKETAEEESGKPEASPEGDRRL